MPDDVRRCTTNQEVYPGLRLQQQSLCSAGWTVWYSEANCANVAGCMNTPDLLMLQYVGKTPSLAGCSKCQLKFFTLAELMKHPAAAIDYLKGRFANHYCTSENSEQRRRLRIVNSSLGVCDACNLCFRASAYLRTHAQQAELDVRRKFSRHGCRDRKASLTCNH